MGKKLLEGKVARVLNSREVAINIGSQLGVREGMHFSILDTSAEDITDPDTGEIIGSMRRPKVEVRVIATEENFCVAKTFKKSTINIGGELSESLSWVESMRPAKYVDKYETLKTQEKTWEDLSEEESYVKTGDPVIEIKEETEVS